MKHNHRQLYFLAVLAVMFLFTSCKVFYPSRMLRTGHDYSFSLLSDTQRQVEYILAPNDEISILVTTNNGEKLLNSVLTAGTDQSQAGGQPYLIDFEGTINLPVLRKTTVSGLTIREAEKMLEEKFSTYFNNPFVKIRVMNNRVVVFPGGEGGEAKVVKLENPNTTLFEALALAGGITDGKAYKIKLIRGEYENRKIYLIDLSTVEGLKQADLVLMANDIIYIEPVYKVPQTVLAQLTPYLSLVTTVLVIWALFR